MIATNIMIIGSREALDVLDAIRDKYDNYLIAFSFEAALRIKDGAYLFDHYAKYVKKGRKSYEGQEILEVMDHYIDFQPEYRLADLYDLTPVHRRNESMNQDWINWDQRWVKVLMEIDEMLLVCRLSSKGDSRCIDYLVQKLETNKKLEDNFLKDIIRGLIQSEYPKIMDLVLQVLEEYFAKPSQYFSYYFHDFVRVLRLLPPENAEVLERFAVNCQHKEAAKLFEAAQYLKSKQHKQY